MSLLHDPITRRRALERLSLVVGGVLAAPLASGLLAGCRTPAPGEVYTYQLLDEGQQKLLSALVDQIIPTTDTPGASEAGVPQFIDKMLAEWYEPADRDRFVAGLRDFESATQQETGTPFADLETSAQMARVAALDATTFAPSESDQPTDDDVAEAAQEGTYAAEQEQQNEVAGVQGPMGEESEGASDVGSGQVGGDGNARPPAAPSRVAPDASRFYRDLKQLTLAGYYTSEVGATQELRYNAVMGEYNADVPLSEIGRAWA